MIGYHYSPKYNGNSIAKHGLLVPSKHPKLTEPVVCSAGHRNPHISLGTSPFHAWELSGGFLWDRAFRGEIDDYKANLWNLYQVNLNGIRYFKSGTELQVRRDITKGRVILVGHRYITDRMALD